MDRAVQDGAEGTGIGICRAEMQQLWIGTLAGQEPVQCSECCLCAVRDFDASQGLGLSEGRKRAKEGVFSRVMESNGAQELQIRQLLLQKRKARCW